ERQGWDRRQGRRPLLGPFLGRLRELGPGTGRHLSHQAHRYGQGTRTAHSWSRRYRGALRTESDHVRRAAKPKEGGRARDPETRRPLALSRRDPDADAGGDRRLSAGAQPTGLTAGAWSLSTRSVRPARS